MSQLQPQPRFGALQIGIILLTIATAVIHIVLAFDWLFYANALGYLGLLALLYLPVPAVAPYRGTVRWVLIAYTAVTIIAWIFIGTRDPLAYLTKAIEVVLIVLLYMEGQQARS
jgi:hypothetical protein